VSLLLGALLLMQAAEPVVVRTEAVPLPGGRLDIPDVIAPAVVPYVTCLFASRGIGIGAPGRIPAGFAVGMDCASHRTRAEEQADLLLKQQSRWRRARRTAFIETTLKRAEDYVEAGPMGKAP
jgi:hypothetical protein